MSQESDLTKVVGPSIAALAAIGYAANKAKKHLQNNNTKKENEK